ncbi:MAG TPA: hypothetical protein VFA65_06875 [Bryobacteraceae bacterium]|nr:hypothetical protein [Bryobacteraceae bacterium]
MLKQSPLLLCCVLFFCVKTMGQEAASAFSLPITLSGDARAAHEWPADGDEKSLAAGFRAILFPSLKINQHWFVYSVLDAHSSAYFPYATGASDNDAVQFNLMQAYIGYTTTVSKASLLIKAGQLSSAFGLFPLEYDDAKMALIDAPPVYTNYVPLRPDQLPCGVSDILRQTYGSEIGFNCGGSLKERYGITPVTLFGLPAVEAELSIARVDARLQITNSSPANRHGLLSDSQLAQWTAGAGYTLGGGLHVAASGFRGPYLDRDLSSLLSAGANIRSFSASGLGVDAEWSRGLWSIEGEWQHFRYELPGFAVSPTENAAYAQARWILSPRFFLGLRASAQRFGRIQDGYVKSADLFAGPRQVYEATLGYRLSRHELLKLGSTWTNENFWSVNGRTWPQNQGYTFEAQLVTSLTAVSKAFR